jgi:hypothetical protein
MSLILATRFEGGILVASDPFVFDNDGEMPSKTADFNKLFISSTFSCVIAAVGSRWVFTEAQEWLNSRPEDKLGNWIRDLASMWKELNLEWKGRRSSEISDMSITTLRPLSESLFVLAHTNNLASIQICDSEGNLHQTESFIISGSGADLVRNSLQAAREIFRPSDSLETCLDLVEKCYRAARHDLYVIGFPAIAIVRSEGIIDFTKDCEQMWFEFGKTYFENIKSTADYRLSKTQSFSKDSGINRITNP